MSEFILSSSPIVQITPDVFTWASSSMLYVLNWASSSMFRCSQLLSCRKSNWQKSNWQKCPMKIQCRVHSVYSWTFHWEHVTAITYYAYKFQIFSNIPKYFQLLGCLDLLFELQRTLQGHSSPATASYHQAAKAPLSLGVDKPPQILRDIYKFLLVPVILVAYPLYIIALEHKCFSQKRNFYNRKGGGQKNAGHAEFWNTTVRAITPIKS